MMLFCIYNIKYKYCPYVRNIHGSKGGVRLKVVFASTPEQLEKIDSLIHYFYSNIFPGYFSEQEIKQFKDWDFLSLAQSNRSETLKESYQIISSLEIMIELIESGFIREKHYQNMFNTNVQILNKLGISFPFSYEQFLKKRNPWLEEGSTFLKAANEFLV